MITKQQYEQKKAAVLEYLEKVNIVLTEAEKQKIEVTDFGLGDIDNSALQLITYINTQRVCAKELVLLPGQTCPEHRHPPFGDYMGKEETFRCRCGTVYLYVEGEPTDDRAVEPPLLGNEYYTVFHEIELNPGEQFTIPVNTKHWFAAGKEGAVVSEFSTVSFDEEDVFTNPDIRRVPEL